ncbi:MAG: hypothetical protein Q9218_008376, partial [Villophora microphyllina]
MPRLFLLATLILSLSLTLAQPIDPLTLNDEWPQPYIFNRGYYMINYTHNPFSHGTTRHNYPVTTQPNFVAGVNDALTYLQSLRASAHASALDPIPSNRFEYEVALRRQSPQYKFNPRKIKFTMEGRFALIPALALRYEE